MNRHKALRRLLLAAYGVPYAFLCVYGDAMHGTMLYYGLMIAALWLLFRAALRLEAGWLILWGNALSFGASLAALGFSSLEERAWYFKPLTPLSLIALIAGAAAAVQGIILLGGRKKRRQNG